MTTSKKPGASARPANPGRKTGPAKSVRKSSRRREIGLLVGLTALLAILLVPRLGSGSGVPAELYGRWTTADDPRYADRALVITDSTVAFYMGDAPISVHRIRGTHSKPGEFGGVQHDIEYRTDGESQSVSVIYEASPTQILRLTNQPGMEWTKDGSIPD